MESLQEMLKMSSQEFDCKIVIQCLREYEQKLRIDQNRLGIQLEDFAALETILTFLTDRIAFCRSVDLSVSDLWNEWDLLLQCMTYCFRVVRNACVENCTNQDIALQCHLHESAIKILYLVFTVQDTVISVHTLNQDNRGIFVALQVGIQMLGNLVTQNDTNKDSVWKSCYPGFVRHVLNCADTKAMEYMCMVIYNCLDNKRGRQLACADCKDIREGIIRLSRSGDAEWSLLVLDQLICLGHFPVLVDATTDTNARVILLDMLAQLFSGTSQPMATATQSSDISKIGEDTVNTVSSLFSSTAVNNSSSDNSSLRLTECLVHTLCCLSADERILVFVQAQQDVLIKAVSLLISIVTNASAQEKVAATSLPVDCGSSIKRDLVRLIGNLCYQNQTNQCKVREIGGIPAILSACNIDDSNPFIREWAVFAIRNLCDGNVENQALISQLEQQGMVDSPLWNQLGLEVSIGPDGTPKVRTKRPQSET
ncbi:ataxin-10-like [Corticium candelabrum]|uniref:ataxin-10-like n=1 Tax=Corticium candelabrum TaxID=121492 RepID=UPI002E264CA6|nr:ataxin-10-like [Corticium candelabrum]